MSILEQELGKDGYLSPGDYDLLIKTARQIQITPGLSTAQRSKYDVKIANFEKNKSVSEIDKKEDINSLEEKTKNIMAQNTMVFGNSPQDWLKTMVDEYQSNIMGLQESIARREASGQDTTEYQMELQNNLAAYREKQAALNASNNFNGKDPINDYVAYIATNDKGEIVNVDYGKYQARPGYVETNGIINGMQIYGKVNIKRDGKNYFNLGNKVFQAPDIMIPDPNNPGSFTTSRLHANVKQKTVDGKKMPYTTGKAGYINLSSNDVHVQSYMPRNSFAKGVEGTIYKRRGDGRYTKYLNVNQSLPDIPEDMITLPKFYEQSIGNNVDETIDFSEPITPDQGTNMAPADQNNDLNQNIFGGGGLTPYSQQNPFPSQRMSTPPAQSPQTRRTPQQPTKNASEGIASTMQRTIRSGADYLKNLFS